ncbi:MAG: hypothetical protein ABJA67_18460 [Chthonomonadales bacterium]
MVPLLAAIAYFAQTPAVPAQVSAKVGHLSACWSVKDGLAVEFDGTKVVAGSLLRVVPVNSATPLPLDSSCAFEKLPNGGTRFTVTFHAKDASQFSATEQVDILPTDTLIFRLRGTAVPAKLDWCTAEISGAPLAGAKWKAEGVDYSYPTGVISEAFKTAEFEKSFVNQKFWTMDIVGSALRIKLAPGQDSPDAIVADGKPVDTDWPKGERRFWLGFVGVKSVVGETFMRTIRVDLLRVGKP